MANKRMFTMKICDSDAFLEMPLSAQCLYFHLNMRADDDGFIGNPRKVMRIIGAAEDDLKILIGKNGSMLKEIGTKARIDLEEYFNKKVFLSLYVKVIKDWRDKDKFISELGLKDDLGE